MSTTQTSHEPGPGELAAHADGDAAAAGHGTAGHSPAGHGTAGHGTADHGDESEHGHGGEALGPIDLAAWGALLLGIAAGLAVALCLYVTTVLLKSPVAG